MYTTRTRMAAVCIVCAILPGLLGSKRPAPPPPPPPPQWTPIWGDEFDGKQVDTRKWNIADHNTPNYDGGVNSYDTSNIWQQDNCLFIRSRCQNLNAQKFDSGRVTTKGKFSFLYGKVEIRARLAGSQGMWPAFWLLQSDGVWPPEIDMMELLGNDPTRVYLTHHWGPRMKDHFNQTQYAGPDFTKDFHVFTIEWDPGKIRWLIDGVERKVVTQNVPSKAMYLILNTSVGGDWPGMPDDSTVFPAYTIIDYVHVYKRTNTH